MQAILEYILVNSVDDVIAIDKAELQSRAPQIKCASSLWAPSTGFVDSHALMLKLQGDLANAGDLIMFNTKVTGGAVVN